MKFGTRSALTPAGWESMVALLDPLRLYDLSPESFVSRELMAYAAGLALFRQRLEQCRDDLFLATCSLERLARWEELLDLPVARTDEASRREMAAVKLSIGEGDFTPEGIRRSLLAAGLEAELEEDFSQRLIRVTDARIIGGYQTLDEVKAQVRRMSRRSASQASRAVCSGSWAASPTVNAIPSSVSRAENTWVGRLPIPTRR